MVFMSEDFISPSPVGLLKGSPASLQRQKLMSGLIFPVLDPQDWGARCGVHHSYCCGRTSALFCFVGIHLGVWDLIISRVHLPRWLDGRICLQCRRPGFSPWVGKIPWGREWLANHSCILAEFHGQRSLVVYSPWDCKGSDITEQLPLFLLSTSCTRLTVVPSLCLQL